MSRRTAQLATARKSCKASTHMLKSADHDDVAHVHCKQALAAHARARLACRQWSGAEHDQMLHTWAAWTLSWAVCPGKGRLRSFVQAQAVACAFWCHHHSASLSAQRGLLCSSTRHAPRPLCWFVCGSAHLDTSDRSMPVHARSLHRCKHS